MSTLTYKCPSCGAPLIYQGDQQELQCGSCGNSFPGEVVRKVNEIEQQDVRQQDSQMQVEARPFSPEESERTKTFSCSSCGAELLTDETTVATNCAFCGSPSIIPAQFTPGTRPDLIIPFLVKKEQAENMFHSYFRGRKLIPNLFLKGRNQIDEIRQLYVPFWLFSCTADGRMTYDGTRVLSSRQGQYMVTTTQHYMIRRAGTLAFSDLPIDASEKVPNDISETLEPYNVSQSIAFSPETLSGAMANRANVTASDAISRAKQRINYSTERIFRSTVNGYNSVSTRSQQIVVDSGKSIPALFPIWWITTKKEGRTYTFAINGQTGELTCDIPYSKGKFFGWMLGVGLAVAAAAFLVVGALMKTGVIS